MNSNSSTPCLPSGGIWHTNIKKKFSPLASSCKQIHGNDSARKKVETKFELKKGQHRT